MSRAVVVGVVDSGINPRHRQVGLVAGGVSMAVHNGSVQEDDAWHDELGHGTASAATICGHAPNAQLFSIRIFRRRLHAHPEALMAAMEWAISREVDVLNLSLGCTDVSVTTDIRALCERATDAGVIIVATAPDDEVAPIPGSFASVIGVSADPSLSEEELRWDGTRFIASSWARSLGELPKEKNFHGVSLAVAHVSGMIARLLEDGPQTVDGVRSALAARV